MMNEGEANEGNTLGYWLVLVLLLLQRAAVLVRALWEG